jgi:hypothetical protein
MITKEHKEKLELENKEADISKEIYRIVREIEKYFNNHLNDKSN